MHTCFFFPLICLACFPSSATASTDRFGDGHFSAEIDLSQAGGGGGYVEKGQNISISNRYRFDLFFRVTTCQQPRRLLHVSSRRCRPASEHVVPAASGQTTLLSEHLAANLARLAGFAGSAGLVGLVRVCTHAFSFPSSAWSATASTDRFCDGHFSAEIDLSQAVGGGGGGWGGGGGTLKRVKISRFQIDASLTDYFALRRTSSRGDSYTSPVVVVGRLASTWCQRPNDTSLGASGRKPRAARWARWIRWARWLRWARRARTCMHTCVFFPLICLACFPSSATPSTDRFGDGHFSAEIDLSQAGGVR